MWSKPPNKLIINSNDVHIWKIHLGIDKSLRNYLFTFLSTDEKERVNRFKFSEDKNDFITCRGILRVVIGRYIDINPAEIVFKYSKYGKPIFSNSNKLNFNVSHSADNAVFAFTEHKQIGVDLEWIEPNIEIQEIATRFFSKNESEKLLNLSKEEQIEGFYNCWTRKEAFIKAIGEGLSFPLDQFEVSLAPNETTKLLKTYWNQDEVSEWFLESFSPSPNFIATLAVKGKVEKVHYWKWDESNLTIIDSH